MFYYRTQLDENYHKADCSFNCTNIWMGNDLFLRDIWSAETQPVVSELFNFFVFFCNEKYAKDEERALYLNFCSLNEKSMISYFVGVIKGTYNYGIFRAFF